jgi:sn-glycerol 3-phosphate transport system substrate-binding protein
MRRPQRLTIFVALAVLALFAAACGGGDSGDSTTDASGGGEASADLPECPLDALESATEPVEITVWHTLTATTKEALEAQAEAYNASQDRVVVEIQSVGTAAEELGRKYTQGIASGDLPNLAIFEDTQNQFLADSGTILPATSCIVAGGDEPDWLPIAPGSYTVDGTIWPSAFNLSTPIMYFNEDHFEDAGLDPTTPPQTLDEIRAAAEAIQDSGAAEKPFIFQVNPWFLESWMTGVGQTVVNENNGRDAVASEATLDNTNVIDLLTWLQGMQDDGLLNAVRQTEGGIDQYTAMATQQGSMLLETSTAAVAIESFLKGELDTSELTGDGRVPEGIETSLRISAAPLPGVEEAGQAQVAGSIWMNTTAGTPEQQAAAWDFMSWWNQLPQQVTWNLEGSYLPSVQGATDDPVLQETWETTVSGQALATAYAQLEGVDPDFPGPTIGPYFDFRAVVRSGMESVIFDGADPAEAAASMQEDATESLTTYEEENF